MAPGHVVCPRRVVLADDGNSTVTASSTAPSSASTTRRGQTTCPGATTNPRDRRSTETAPDSKSFATSASVIAVQTVPSGPRKIGPVTVSAGLSFRSCVIVRYKALSSSRVLSGILLLAMAGFAFAAPANFTAQATLSATGRGSAARARASRKCPTTPAYRRVSTSSTAKSLSAAPLPGSRRTTSVKCSTALDGFLATMA